MTSAITAGQTGTSTSNNPNINANPFAGMTSDTSRSGVAADKLTTGNAPSTASGRLLAARDMTRSSSRSLTDTEKKTVTQAVKDAKVLLERTEYALTDGWNQRVAGSNLTQRQVFEQYFGGSSEKMRVEVLTRLQRVEKMVDRMLSSDIGNSVARGTGRSSTGFAYTRPGINENVYVADKFFSQASNNPNTPDSKAGTIVHELFHLAQYNGQRGTDAVPGYKDSQYGADVLRQLANTSPQLAVQNNNLFEWYVEREK
jgi:hypothetical protein